MPYSIGGISFIFKYCHSFERFAGLLLHCVWMTRHTWEMDFGNPIGISRDVIYWISLLELTNILNVT